MLSPEGFQQIAPQIHKEKTNVSILKMYFERETSLRNIFAKI